MSEQLDSLGQSIFNAFLPSMWSNLAPKSEKPLGSWINHFQKRYGQYENWIANGEPQTMWLSGLHIPESYLAALIQSTCRKRHWPLDKSVMFTKVSRFDKDEDVTTKLDYGCYVSGLYLEGAAW